MECATRHTLRVEPRRWSSRSVAKFSPSIADKAGSNLRTVSRDDVRELIARTDRSTAAVVLDVSVYESMLDEIVVFRERGNGKSGRMEPYEHRCA
jgi:hypothetical protein